MWDVNEYAVATTTQSKQHLNELEPVGYERTLPPPYRQLRGLTSWKLSTTGARILAIGFSMAHVANMEMTSDTASARA